MMNKKTMEEPYGRRGEPTVDDDAIIGSILPPTNNRKISATTSTSSISHSHVVVDDVMEWLDHTTTKLSQEKFENNSRRSINSDIEQGGMMQHGVSNNDDEINDDGGYSEGDASKSTLLTQTDYRSSISSLSTGATSRRSAEPPGLYHGALMDQHPPLPQQRPMMLSDLSTSEAVAILVPGTTSSTGTTLPPDTSSSSSSVLRRGSSLARDASGKVLVHTSNNTPTTTTHEDACDDDKITEQLVNDKPAHVLPDNRTDPDGGDGGVGGAYSECSDSGEEEDDDDEEKFIKAILDSPETTRRAAATATAATTATTTAAAAVASNQQQQQQQQQPGAYSIPGRREAVNRLLQASSNLAYNNISEPITAVVVSSGDDDNDHRNRHHQDVHDDIPTATVTVEHDDSTSNNNDKGSITPSSRSNNSRMRIVGVVLLVVFSVVVIGLVGAMVGKKQAASHYVPATAAPTPAPPVDPDDLWYKVMDPIDGSPGSEFGSSVSMCSDGSRVAIGAQGSGEVQVYELDTQLPGGRRQIGQTINATTTTTTTTTTEDDMLVPFIRSQVVVELARNCKVLAIGYPFANVGNKSMVGQVALYEYDSSFDSWLPLGDPHIIPGEEASDFAGASLSLSQTGDRVAIGSPGNDWAGEDAGRARVFLVNQGGWVLLGTAINGTFPGEEFGGSISLTSDDTTDIYILAVGSSSLRTMPSEEYVFTLSAEVARVYEFQTGKWSQRGQGIVPNVLGIDTAWFVKLSTDGKKLVVSNLYLDPDGVRVTDGEVNSGIYVSAFELDMMGNWGPRGGNIHANFPGKKSGYIISLSDDGSRIGMGDPGRAEAGGLAGHSHFYEFIGDQWCQLGPNIHGESAGDMAGYSVSLSGDGRRMVVASPRSRAQGLEHGRVNVVELHEELIVPVCEGISF